MSTAYSVNSHGPIELSLDEMSCRFTLTASIDHVGQADLTKAMEVDEVIDLVAKIIGPLCYFEDYDKVKEKLDRALKAGGYAP